jgi:hypothetical protein
MYQDFKIKLLALTDLGFSYKVIYSLGWLAVRGVSISQDGYTRRPPIKTGRGRDKFS